MRSDALGSYRYGKEERISLFSNEHSGLGSIIEITERQPKPKRDLIGKISRIPLNLWGTFILSVLVILSPIFIYNLQYARGAFDPTSQDPNKYHGLNMPRLKWGIAGLGRISHDFCAVLIATGANVTAVSAGTLPYSWERAETFAQRFEISVSYGTYEDLAKDPNVDIVYIGTTTNLHYMITIMMLNAGKHVIVERPPALNSDDVKEMYALAKEKVFYYPIILAYLQYIFTYIAHSFHVPIFIISHHRIINDFKLI